MDAKPKPEAETLSSSQQCRHHHSFPNQQPHRCPLTPPTPSAMPLRSSNAASAPMLCDWEPQSFLLSFKLLGLRFCFTFKLSRRSAFSSLLDFKDYAWVKRGSLFPFMDYIDRFQDQSELGNCKPCDFQMATEEGFLVDQGFSEKLIADINMAAGNPVYDESVLRGVQEATGSNHDLDYQFVDQDIYWKKKDARVYEGCGSDLRMPKKMKVSTSGGQFLCKSCAKLTKHVCGICKKWNQPDSGSWVVEGPYDSVPIPDGAALSAFQYFENVRNFLVAVEELGLPTFEASDLEQGGKSASTRIVNCVLALKSYSDWKKAGGSGSWKFVGNLKPPISGKPFLRKNSEPFMSSFTRTLSWSERSQDSFSCEDPNEASSSHSLHKLAREVLLDKKQEEIPFVKAHSKDSPGPDSDSPSLSEPGSGDIKNEEKAATEIKKDDCCNQTYDHQEGSKEKYLGMKFLQMKYQEDFNS
ncbi:kinesin-like protein KIN-14F isoform X2 [Rosa chinensis]|uniref:kinesin-like protein KIN-14F isoform X2 n=1 Tax=Rosa chinensis TaxID=74649 RepID=UPI000D0922D7|nr:kinesin-like protein KIN-14F isoform X2 [Rosa chinensis]